MASYPDAQQKHVSRRKFTSSAAGAGAMLALAPHLHARPGIRSEPRTLFFNLSHENYDGHTYYLVIGRQRHLLTPVGETHPALARARRTNSLLAQLPNSALTHVIENIQLPPAVHLAYTIKDPDTASGTWGMSSFYLLPPKSSFGDAYEAIRSDLRLGEALPLSVKRKKYALLPALTLQDLLDEQDLLDTNDWATAMVNVHPEMLSADPTSAALIQTKYINVLPATAQLGEVLASAGTAMPQESTTQQNTQGWATLVPYTDSDGITPLKNTTGHNKGLILYDAKWQPGINTPWVSAAMKPALRSVKNDPSLGADVTAGRASLSSSALTGRLWYRNDGVAGLNQTAEAAAGSGNATYTLTNVTPNYNGYSLAASFAPDNKITLDFKNWYLHWLGVYIQFYDSAGKVLPASLIPPGISANKFLDQQNSLFLGILTPEFTIFGVPIMPSKLPVNFTFPTDVAHSAAILASGLGFGSHTFPETEHIGIVNTSIFNLIVPALLLVLGLGAAVDDLYRDVVLSAMLAQAFLVEFFALFSGASPDQLGTIFWRLIVRGAATPVLRSFLDSWALFFAKQSALVAVEDAIPIVGALLQALGALAVVAEMAETSIETILSPWTYQCNLVGTYDLSLNIYHDPKDKSGFPAAAATYTVSAIFDGGTPHTQTLTMSGNAGNTLPPVIFSAAPLGGLVTLTVVFYTSDNTQVGHGTTGPVPNQPPQNGHPNPSITITEDRLPLRPSTVYAHKQKTVLNAQGDHLWVCGPAPAVPSSPSACQPNPGNICQFRDIAYNSGTGYLGYGWQSYSTAGCQSGASGQLDQMANIPSLNGGGNAQTGYATVPCSLGGPARLVYDPLGRPEMNYYLDTTDNVNVLRQVQLKPPQFADPRTHQAWGKFNLPPDDLLLHPAGTVLTINTATSRMESLKLPATPLSDAEAAISLLANLHSGQGSRPGLFHFPMAATVSADGVILIVEAGNNRIHAVDAAGNPVRHFSHQPEPYFLNLSETGGSATEYLDIAVEFSGFIYLLSMSNSVYRLDIYDRDQSGTTPFCTTMGFNAAKVTVDYWRNVYSLNYEVLMVNGNLPASGVTEPSVSQWIPTAPPACEGVISAPPGRREIDRRRLLRRRDLWGTYTSASRS